MGQYTKDRVTIYEVAKAAGVSLATVSRVINNHQNVTEKTRRQVESAVERLGYKPSALAQGLATNRSTNIGIVIPSTNYVYIANMLSGMTDIATIYGFTSTLFVTQHSKEEAKQVFSKLITSHVDGAVIYDDQLDEEDLLEMQKFNLPIVTIGHETSAKRCASIMLDYEPQLLELLSHNVSVNNNHKICFLNIEHSGLMIENLLTSTRKFAQENELKLEVISCSDSYSRLYLQMLEYFDKHKSGGYFICPRDSHACAVLNAALEKGLKIPEEVEIVSVVGTKYSYIARPQLSSLEIDMFEVGSIAMRMLTKLLKNNELQANVLRRKPSYTARGSTID